MDLKSLHESAIPSALERAKHYRLLNDPENAESICRDILELNSDHQAALITLILSLADQYNSGSCNPREARSFLEKLDGEYDRIYYGGLICERAARAMLSRSVPGSNHSAYDLFRDAMDLFESAEKLSPENNDDAILRWNACLRSIQKHNLERRPEDNYVPYGD